MILPSRAELLTQREMCTGSQTIVVVRATHQNESKRWRLHSQRAGATTTGFARDIGRWPFSETASRLRSANQFR